MDMKKTAKKIAALVAGTTMLGATIMGATALDLSNYPAPFVSDGVFSGKIVVGANAATSDVVGAIDLAASLQAAATSSMEVEVPGAAGEASVSGDSAEFKVGSDVVTLGETIGSVKSTFTSSDLAALKSGVLDTGLGSTPVKQYMKFDNTTMYVKYDENDDDQVSDYLYIASDSTLFEYHVEFTEGAESEVETDNDMADLHGEVLTLLGAPFTIVDTNRNAASISLTLLGGQVADVLRDGETKTYTIDGVDYEVTAVFISSTGSAKLQVNGVMSRELTEGKTQVLGTDVTVGVQSILTNNREGMVEFYLGANKLELTDSNHEDSDYAAGTVKVKGNSVANNQLIIKATNTSDNIKLNYIKYKVSNDEDLFIMPEHGMREALDDDAKAMLADTWDLKYAGLVKTGSSEFKLDAVSDHSYKIDFENINGDKISFPYLTKKGGVFKFGDDDDDLIFEESSAPNGGTAWTVNGTFVSDNDYFIVADRATGADETKAATKVLRYSSINAADNTVTFNDLSGGELVVSFTGDEGSSATGDLIVDGASHTFYVGASGTDPEDYALSIDLDGTGGIANNTVIRLVTKGGAVVDLGSAALNFDAAGPVTGLDLVNLTIRTTASKFDESSEGAETSTVAIDESTGNTVDISSVTLGGTVASLVQDPDNDDYSRGYTDYGALFELYNPSSSTSASELTINYPDTQRYAQVFLTAGTVEVKEGAIGESGKLTSTTLNPIAVGLAVLDTEAPDVGSAKMIVVGGPCVNVKAAELMGNPADCAEGFTPGKAVIKLFESQNALLVAGYSAQDTLGACYVLADAADYDLSGDEVEVVVADLNTITVNTVE
ncbi:S-layer protein [Candidatus Woesearchaeota archaeon]|nr:S-layer protein [Candidatus Woesearchaeota archaeon]